MKEQIKEEILKVLPEKLLVTNTAKGWGEGEAYNERYNSALTDTADALVERTPTVDEVADWYYTKEMGRDKNTDKFIDINYGAAKRFVCSLQSKYFLIKKPIKSSGTNSN